MNLSSNSIAMAGEFAVLSQLALRGVDANLTLGHTKSVDILGSDPESGNMFRLEVKTSYKNIPSRSKLFGYTLGWVMGEKHENIQDSNLYYCFVNIEPGANAFRFFIIPSKTVSVYVRDQHQFWLNRDGEKSTEVGQTTMRKFRVGLDDGGYLLETPLAKDYENKWDFYK